jgi:hypothetical protein
LTSCEGNKIFVIRELAGMLGHIQEHISAELENRVTQLDPQLDPRERVGKTPQQLTRVPPPIAICKRWQFSNHKILMSCDMQHRWTHAKRESALGSPLLDPRMDPRSCWAWSGTSVIRFLGTDLGLLRPAWDEIHHLIPHIMQHPGRGQSSPRLLFNAMCSAISSARTSSLVCTFFSKNSIRFCFSSAWRRGRSVVWKAGRSVLEELFLPAVEHRRLQSQFFTQIRNRDLV